MTYAPSPVGTAWSCSAAQSCLESFQVSSLLTLPAADNEASHQEDEKNNSPSDGHGQDGGLVRVPNSQNIYTGDRENIVVQWISKTSVKDDGMKLRMFSVGVE